MTREQAKDEVKGRLEEYLRGRGISTNKPFKCMNPEHGDEKPSMSYDRNRKKVHCFACNASYDIFDLIGIEYGFTDPKDQFEKAYELFKIDIESDRSGSRTSSGKKKADPKKEPPRRGSAPGVSAQEEEEAPPVDYMDFYAECMKHINETDYLQKRGISPETAARFLIGFAPEWRHPKSPACIALTPRLIIPTSRTSYLARDTRDKLTDIEKQYSKSKVGRVHLWNPQGVYKETAAVFITEGEIDALSIAEVGGEACALGSAGNYRKLAELVENKRPSAALVLALDNDSAGQKATEELKAELDRLGVIYTTPDIYGESKDANEALVKDRAAFERAIASATAEAQAAVEAEKEEYISSVSVKANLDAFRQNVKDSAKTAFYPTGFNNLDSLLDGGLYPGLYFVGAISALGKTTFCLQICDNIAASGQDVIIFSLEMSRDELIAKSVSRESYIASMGKYSGKRLAKTTRGILTGSRYEHYDKEELENIENAIERYSSYADHIFIHEGVGNIGVEQIREIIEKHIKITKNRPVVMIDYLQIMAPYDVKATDKQNTDKAVLELKRLSRDKSIPILAISSFNRDNYTAPVNMAAFKESGAVEYSSDVLIGVQYEGMDWQEGESDKTRNKRVRELFESNALDARIGNPQKIQAKVLKNRNGAKGEALLELVSMFNYFTEKKHQEPEKDKDEDEEKYQQQTLASEEWETVPPGTSVFDKKEKRRYSKTIEL